VVRIKMHAEKVRHLREERGLSKRALAQEAGLARKTGLRAERSQPVSVNTACTSEETEIFEEANERCKSLDLLRQ
jgi:transcriptional regulator with XRE-family HTH domain